MERLDLTYFLFLIALGTLCVAAISVKECVVYALDPVNPANKNRLLDSFTDEECWKHLRFRKTHIRLLMKLMKIPIVIVTSNGVTCPGEHAFALMLWRMHYPSTLSLLQNYFGRDYTQLSRIFNTIVDFVDANHRHKVQNNIDWYRNISIYFNL